MRRSTTSRTRHQIHIRRCRVVDIPRLLDLWKRASAGPSVSDNPDAIRRRLHRDRHLFLLAWDEKRLVGSLIGGWDGWRASMYRLAVDPDYRRRGIARRLVTAVENELREIGATRIGALVFTYNRSGQAFWSSESYSLDEEVARYVKDLGDASGSRRSRTGSRAVAGLRTDGSWFRSQFPRRSSHRK